MDLHMEHAPSQSEDFKKFAFLFICAATVKIVQKNSSIPKSLSTYNDLDRQTYLNRIRQSDRISIAMIRMDRKSFYDLSKMIRERHLLCDSIHVSVEEQLMMFLHTIGHNQKNRVIGHNFSRSGETVSRYFKKTLNAIASLKDELMSPPDVTIPDKIKSDFRFWPFFKDCIGAIDGTHVPARVPSSIVGRFRGRYQGPTQNIMAVVRFDLIFSYILAGWEGSANDCTVLRNALERPNGLTVPEGKYFLVDAGYFTKKGFISPYRGTRYHLKDFSEDNPPTNSKELFNLRHSSLRTTIERAFGVLKKRFKILTCYPYFPYPTQVALVLVCCILHNFIIGVSPRDRIVRAVERRLQTHSNPCARSTREQREENLEWAALRDQIADQMWKRDYGSI